MPVLLMLKMAPRTMIMISPKKKDNDYEEKYENPLANFEGKKHKFS